MSDGLTTWRKELSAALAANGETWSDIEVMTLTDAQLDREFDDETGGNGDKFTVWTKNRIYFLAQQDDPEWVSSTLRNQSTAKCFPH